MTKITAGRGTLNVRDIIKGLLIAVITPVFTIIGSSIDAGTLTFNWKWIGSVAVFAGLSYLVKNLLTPSQIIVTDPGQVQSVKDGEPIVVRPDEVKP